MKPQAHAPNLHAAHVNGGSPLLRSAGVFFDGPEGDLPGVTLPGQARRSAPAQTAQPAPAATETRTAEYRAPDIVPAATRTAEEPVTAADVVGEQHATLARSLEQISGALTRLDENQTRIVNALTGQDPMPGAARDAQGVEHTAPTREELQRRAEQMDRQRAELRQQQEILERDMRRTVSLTGLDRETVEDFNLARAAVIARYGVDDQRVRSQRWVETDIIAAYMRRDTMGIGAPGLGAVLLPTEVSSSIQGRLVPRNILMRLGMRVLPMGRTFEMIFPQVDTGSEAFWTGSEKEIQDTDMSYGYYRLSAKPLASMASFTDDGEYFTNGALSRELENQLLLAQSEAIDRAGFTGLGGAGQPTGIANTDLVTSIDWGALSGGTATEVSIAALSGASQKITDILDEHQFALMELDALDGDARTAFAANPSLYKILKRSKDADGNPLLFNPAIRGQTAGTVRTLTSTGIGEMYDTVAGATTKLAYGAPASGNLSDFFYGDFNKLVMGQFGPLEMRVTDSHGTDFKYGRMRILMKQRVDIVAQRGQHFTAATNLKLVA